LKRFLYNDSMKSGRGSFQGSCMWFASLPNFFGSDLSQALGPFGCVCLISGNESVHRSTTDTRERVSSALPSFFPRSQVHGCFRHLALPKLRQKDLIHGSLPAAGADDVLLKIRTHGCLVDPDLPHFAIEFLLTLLAFKIDLHWTLHHSRLSLMNS